MADAAEEMEAVLSGKAWDVGGGVGGSAEPHIPVRLGSSVCYVVLAVLFNAEDAVLLVQEAKPQCRGLWYLPAGRVEPHENLGAAVRREVREETGLQCEPLTLLALEERGPMWVRFVFLARHTGGTLKTLRDADAESLQALWWRGDPRALPLRAPDILPLLDLASRYRRAPPHPPTLPQELPCPLLCLRLLVAFPGGSGGDLWVLLSSAAPPRLPVVPWGAHPPRGRRALRLPALQLLRGCMRADPPAVSVGLLGLQHRAEGPGGADGLCLNVLLSVEPPRAADGPPPLRDPEWRWGRVEEEGLKGRILQRVRGGGTVPIRS